MRLKSLKLIQFKNYEDESFSFEPGINAILGRNGSGKTNLLDAIHYLSMTKSALHSSDTQSIRHAANFFTIKARVHEGKRDTEFFCSLKQGAKKTIRFDKVEYEKVSEHIGKLPCVMVSPYDSEVIQGGSEKRRRFFDALISQLDQDYLQLLMRYNHNLKQRNSLLKRFHNNILRDPDLIVPYNHVLLETGKAIYNTRCEFLSEFREIFLGKYAYLSDERESVTLSLESQFDASEPEALLASSLQQDVELNRTTFGIHRDRWQFGMDGYDIKKMGSQGQQKTYLLSLKSAQFELLHSRKGAPPWLLLDDIFDKLDDYRIEKFMRLVLRDSPQIFLTDARPERTLSILSHLDIDVHTLLIENGRREEANQSGNT